MSHRGGRHRRAIGPSDDGDGSSPMANAGEPGALSRAFRRFPCHAGVRRCLSELPIGRHRSEPDGRRRSIGSLSKTCLVRFDSDEDQELIQWINSLRNKYSVEASAVGRPVEVRAYADRIELRQGEPLSAIGPSSRQRSERRWRRRAPARSSIG